MTDAITSIILILLSGIMLIISIASLRLGQKALKNAKDRFKSISGMDYDEYIKRQKQTK